MGAFFIDTSSGQVATLKQLSRAGLSGEDGPEMPWFKINCPHDASTLWHAVLVKEERGIHIGTLTLRHGSNHASLLANGWTEIPPEDVGSQLAGHQGEDEISRSPWTE
ncbi:MAG: hypothetical protein WCL20_04440 [Actinomycetes bacterium]|nr:hypothetical protein [Solirubrobacterales bacterium]